MYKIKSKRGISPVIATILLVMIAIILAIIILLWANQLFNKDKLTKFGGEAIENACDRVLFTAEAIQSEGKIYMVNEGNVPIFGAKVGKKGLGMVSNLGTFTFGNTLRIGESGETTVEGLPSGDIIVSPVLIGESKDTKQVHVCEGQAQTITVK